MAECNHTQTHSVYGQSPAGDGKMTVDVYCSNCHAHISTMTQ